MKKYIIWSLLFLFFISCDRDHVVPDDESSKTAQLRELYLEKIYGKWSYTETSTFYHIEENYDFQADGQVSGHMLLMARDSVFVNGEKVLTDWEKAIDDDVAGKWNLYYDSFLKQNVLSIGNKVVEFIGVNDSILEIQSPLIGGKFIKMHRKE